MNEVVCYDKTTNKTFTLHFDNLYKQRKFLIKCRYSNKLMVLSYTYQSQAEYEYLEFGR